jgi:hypothetical protein
MVEVPRTAAQRKYWPEWDLHLQRTNPPMTKKRNIHRQHGMKPNSQQNPFTVSSSTTKMDKHKYQPQLPFSPVQIDSLPILSKLCVSPTSNNRECYKGLNRAFFVFVLHLLPHSFATFTTESLPFGLISFEWFQQPLAVHHCTFHLRSVWRSLRLPAPSYCCCGTQNMPGGV